MRSQRALRKTVIRVEDYLQIDIFRHPLDQPVRFGQTRPTAEYELNVVVSQIGQRMQCVGDVDIFLENKRGQFPRQPFGRDRINEVFLLGRNYFHIEQFSCRNPICARYGDFRC